MLKTLPSILTAPAQAAPVALSGKTAQLDAAAGTGFARLMQQQADQRLAQQRQDADLSPERRPEAHAAPVPARPAENRPTPDNAEPSSVAASKAAATEAAGKPRADRAQDNTPARPAKPPGEGAGGTDRENHASASPTARKSADGRSTASQTATNNPARVRQAAPAGRSTAADGAAARAGAMPAGSTRDDGLAVPDPVDARGQDIPVPAPDSGLAATLANPASVTLLAADPVAVALPAQAADGASTVLAVAADGLRPRGTAAESTTSWVAAQQRQREPGGSAAGDRGTGRIATDPDDASGHTRRSAARVRTAASSTTAEGQPSAAAWAARAAAESAPTGGAAPPADPATATTGSAGRAGARHAPPAVPIERAQPRLDGGPDVADHNIGAPAASGIAAARATRPWPDSEGGPASTAASATGAVRLGSDATQPGLGAAAPGPSSQADAMPTTGAPPQPAAAPQSGVSAGRIDNTAPDIGGKAKAQRAADSSSLAGAIGTDSTGAHAVSPTPQAGAPNSVAPGPSADTTAERADGRAAATSVPAPAQAASALAVSGADVPGGARRTATTDRAAANPAGSTAPDAASRNNADRDTQRVDRLASARLDSPVPALATGLAPKATAALQTPAGTDGQARANGNDNSGASAVPAAVGVNTAQPGPVTLGLANTPAAAATVEARIAVPVDSPAFAPALGAQVSLFAQDGVQTARLQINPAEMGPITVQIALDGNTARVDFQADRAATRDLIEASLPALAGAMQDAGLTLTGGGVFQQHPGRQPAPEHSPTANAPRNRTPDTRPDSGAVDPAVAGRRGMQRGLVDLVA